MGGDSQWLFTGTRWNSLAQVSDSGVPIKGSHQQVFVFFKISLSFVISPLWETPFGFSASVTKMSQPLSQQPSKCVLCVEMGCVF